MTYYKIKEDVQQPNVGQIIVLYELDTTTIGGSDVFRFTENTTISGSSRVAVKFQGQTWFPLDITSDGWDVSGKGKLPTPKVRVNIQETTLLTGIINMEDLLGAKLERKRTFRKYLDDGAEADTQAEFDPDTFIIQRKSAQNKYYVEFELATYMDFQGKNIPGRVVLRDTCTHAYRIYKDGSFDYTNATCPYTDANYYKRNGDSTVDPAEDNCGKRLSDCRLRFGDAAELPTRAFPGAGRTRG